MWWGGGSRRKSGPKTQVPHSAKPEDTNVILEFWDVEKRDGTSSRPSQVVEDLFINMINTRGVEMIGCC